MDFYRVQPKGWLREFLKTQLSGLTGRIDEAGFPYDTVEWGETDKVYNNGRPEWWVFEQTAYWVDGFTRTAILLEDKDALLRAENIIYRVLNNPDGDGYLGPRILKSGEHASRWPHVVFFRACMALYEYNRDGNIISALSRHYLFERDNDYVWRDVNNVEILLFLYDATGDERFLSFAESSYKKYNDRAGSDNIDKVALSRRKPYEHGVSHNEYSKLGAILYKYTGKKEYLKASLSAYRKAERFFMLPGGCICSNEHMINNKYFQSYETCNITDMTWSMSYIMRVTGDASWGDKIERCVFNAGLGSVLEDFRALQYYSSANQIVTAEGSNHNNLGDERDWMRYSPNPGTACCPGNVNRFMPNYILRAWNIEGNKIYSDLLGPMKFTGEVDGGITAVTLDTAYPFEDTLRYEIKTEKPVILYIRKPRYASEIFVNAHGCDSLTDLGDRYECKTSVNATVTLRIESSIEEVKKAPGVFLRKGALVYSLSPNEKRIPRPDAKTAGKSFPAYDIIPEGEWRYALVGDYTFDGGAFTTLLDKSNMPRIFADARRILNFYPDKRDKFREQGKTDYSPSEYTFTPKLMDSSELILSNEVERVELLPYGTGKIRMTVLNKIEK